MKALRLLRSSWLRFIHVFAGNRAAETQHNFADEIESHLQLHIDDNIKLGMSPEQARREAILKLGGVEMTTQSYRERSTLPWMDDLLQDLRFAIRQLKRSPGFAITAAIMLGLGIAASAAMFAFVDAALLKPLPYRNPNRLAFVTESVKMFGPANLSYPDYLDWKRMNRSFISLDIINGAGFLLNSPSGAEPVAGIRASDGIFRTLGITPMLGRDFYTGEDLPGVQATTIISYPAWKKRFNSRPDVIGQVIELSGNPHTIVGVLPQDFQFALRGEVEFWVPFHARGSCDLRRSCHNLVGIGRLKDGVSMETARAEIQGVAAQLERQYPDSNRGQGGYVNLLSDTIVGDIRPILLTLLAGAGLLLAIACINVSSLLLVRSESRKREMAVRGALGASRTRLIRQFLTEGCLLVGVGATLGVGLAALTMRLMMALIPKVMMDHTPFLQGLGLNLHVLLFTACIALFMMALFAITPMLRLRMSAMRDGLTEGGRGAAGTFWRRVGSNLVVLELALAVILLAAAGLLGKSFYQLLHADVNFNTDHLALVEVSSPASLYPKDEDNARMQKSLIARISALPGVESVGLTSVTPVSFNGNTDWIRFVGRPYDGTHNEVNSRNVNADFMKTLQAKLLRGRLFTESEDATKPKVVLINKALADMYYPGEDPIGKRYGDGALTPASIREIVGVVDNIKEGSLDSDIWPAEYDPIYQDETDYFTLIVRTSQSETSMLPTLVSAIHGLDPGLGAANEETMTMHMEHSETAYIHRLSTWLVGGFAALALVLGVTGLYGVIAYSVAQRTREIGVRMALGAQRSSVYRMVMRQAAILAIIGITVGLGCAIGAGMAMHSLLYGTKAWDVATLASVALVLGVAAMLASYIPAHRAASVNPVDALRAE
jgi:macrolide transport system ATP-binding/permease protein